jgi:signal transduction histidine kinase/DNA-binding response OmpR family regulator
MAPSLSDLTLSTFSGSLDPAGAPAHILVLDDQIAIRGLFEDVLTANNYRVKTVPNLEEAEKSLRQEPFDAVFIDIFLSQNESGLDLLPRLARLQPNTPAIVISGMANMDNVLEALKAGAYDMLCKPFNLVDLLHVVQRAVEKKRMADENDRLLEALRRERDLLERRVREATADLKKTIGTLRLLNEQVATMFEISQAPLVDGSIEEVLRRIFALLGRMFDFSGALCVIYDARACGINQVYTQGEGVEELSRNLADLFQREGATLVELAESEERLPVAKLQNLIWQFYPAPLPQEEVILVPLHVHQTLLGVVGLNCRDRGPTHLGPEDERMLGLAISQLLAALEQRNYMARTGQLASLGELITEIAHDLRHPLTALRGSSRMLRKGWRQEAKRERCLEQITTNLSRMESLVSELVSFYNPKEMNMVAVDLHDLLEKALEVSAALLTGKQIEVVRQYENGNHQILGLTRNLVEAFVNLISNACQAMAPGGRLTVGMTAELNADHGRHLREHSLLPTNYLMVWIADTGCGIPEEHRDRVFRRFFTTKEEGMGLGLSAVQRLVKKNLGHIHFESAVGAGTTFYVYLPKA